MLSPILLVYSTKRTAFSASFLAPRKSAMPLVRMLKRIGPSIDP
jgi:hypothetical protein